MGSKKAYIDMVNVFIQSLKFKSLENLSILFEHFNTYFNEIDKIS